MIRFPIVALIFKRVFLDGAETFLISINDRRFIEGFSRRLSNGCVERR